LSSTSNSSNGQVKTVPIPPDPEGPGFLRTFC
jgi:hypothetical protein